VSDCNGKTTVLYCFIGFLMVSSRRTRFLSEPVLVWAHVFFENCHIIAFISSVVVLIIFGVIKFKNLCLDIFYVKKIELGESEFGLCF